MAEPTKTPTAAFATSLSTTVPAGARRRSRRAGFGRELAGALTVGLSVLAVVVLVFQVLAWFRDVPGPGARMVLGHLGAAVLAVLAQRVADRSTGWLAAAAAVAVVVLTGAAMWFLWWA